MSFKPTSMPSWECPACKNMSKEDIPFDEMAADILFGSPADKGPTLCSCDMAMVMRQGCTCGGE